MSRDYSFEEYEEEMRERSIDEMIVWSWRIIERHIKERNDALDMANKRQLERDNY